MSFSRLAKVRRCAALVLYTSLLVACGSDGSGTTGTTSASNPQDPALDNNIDAPATATVQLQLAVSGNGIVRDGDDAVFCDASGEYCRATRPADSIEQVETAARFGYRLTTLHINAAPTPATTASVVLSADTRIAASFARDTGVNAVSCDAGPDAPPFRSLHLGDSLTAAQCWGNCPAYYVPQSGVPARQSISWYATRMAGNTVAPRIIALGGERSNGTNLYLDRWTDAIAGFDQDNLWTKALRAEAESLDDFAAVVIALGTNDLADFQVGRLGIDDIVNRRIRPLLDWIGNRPVIWMLPHYSHKGLNADGFRLYSTADGIGCSCGNANSVAAGCNLTQALAQCGATPTEHDNVTVMFRTIYQFRRQLFALQDDYPNLQVIDPATLLSQQSNGNYDLFRERRSDTIHLSPQGTEWYAWVHAYAAQLANPACAATPPPTQMSAAEIAMGEALESENSL